MQESIKNDKFIYTEKYLRKVKNFKINKKKLFCYLNSFFKLNSRIQTILWNRKQTFEDLTFGWFPKQQY